jgi:hypothetical protein
MNQQHELVDFVRAVTKGLAEEYDRIQKRVSEDPGTAGDEGEENWAAILREWLPPSYQIVTKGRILGYQGTASPQVDVIVLKPSYPTYLLNKKLYLAAGVAAAFECKLTLRAKDIDETVKNCVATKQLFQRRTGTPYAEITSPIVYGLVAHSHSWKEPNSKPIENLQSRVEQVHRELVKHPREMLDIICVADLVTFSAKRISYMVRLAPSESDSVRPLNADKSLAPFAGVGYEQYRAEVMQGEPIVGTESP